MMHQTQKMQGIRVVELGQLQAGQTVLVHGASGGVGLAACDLARALGVADGDVSKLRDEVRANLERGGTDTRTEPRIKVNTCSKLFITSKRLIPEMF